MIVGKRTVRVGIARIMFDVCEVNSSSMSFVLNMKAVEMRKRDHSKAMLVKLVMQMCTLAL